MSITKYKFVSPGVFINEIDRSRVPAASPEAGPVIIGRTARGPGMRPVKVNSYSEYTQVFGDPVPGGQGGDIWRTSNYTTPMYATYAAQAWLRNGRTATIIRLLGQEHSEKTTAGGAGWGNWTNNLTGAGAFGLFLIDSASGPTALTQTDVTGTLAAIWYVPEDYAGGIVLSGGLRGSPSFATASNATFLRSSGDNWGFKAIVATGDFGTFDREVSFNFNPDSGQFIRKVFNTNPIFTNATMTPTANQEKYWLAHTFERAVNDTLTSSSAGDVYGVMLRLGGISADYAYGSNFSNFKLGAQSATTGWIISQDVRGGAGPGFNPENIPNHTQRLFQLHVRDGGDWETRNLKVSIKDIKSSPNEDVNPYGSFTVQLRRAADLDHDVRVIEEYPNCNLNVHSPDYICKRIGDTYAQWDDATRRFRTYGEYPNISKFVRVEVNEDGLKTDASLLPFGFLGPVRPKGFTMMSSSDGLAESPGLIWVAHSAAAGINSTKNVSAPTFAFSSDLYGVNKALLDISGGIIAGGISANQILPSSSFLYPTIALRADATETFLKNKKRAYWGYDSRKKSGGSVLQLFDPSNIDVLRQLPGGSTVGRGTSTEYGAIFTLDDIKIDTELTPTYVSGSRAAALSATSMSGTYKEVLDKEYNRFTVPFHGGLDGWDVTQPDPVANANLSSGNEKTNYVFNTIRRAIDTCADPEIVDFNLMVAPGMTNDSLTDLMVSNCEQRGDALAIIDIKDVYVGPQENKGNTAFPDRVSTTLDTHVTTFKARKMNSSYGCTYYPWVQVRDSVNNVSLWVPPSVVALGTFASSDRVGELWFAPAGFNRGGLSQGSSGLTVTNVSERLTSDQRDKLYENNINPIASFPNEGIVIFGQKTLDATTSALSRINVRRLLIFLKKEISRLANLILFDNNVQATWGRFKSLVLPLLEDVKVRFGLSDFKLVLDDSTTTPDLIDRNIMYAKIFLKPARAIEFIALDFVIMKTGASFDD